MVSLDDVLVKFLAAALAVVATLLGVVWKQLADRVAALEKMREDVELMIAAHKLETTARINREQDARDKLRDDIASRFNLQEVRNNEFSRDIGRLSGRDPDSGQHGGYRGRR